MISVRLQGNKSRGSKLRRVWLGDKQSESFGVLWALNHSSPDATLLHLDHTHLSMSFMFSSSQLSQMLHKLSYDKFSGHGYTSLPKPDESESGQMVLK